MESIDPTANLIANDNVELACAFIQKKAVEKAIPEIDKRSVFIKRLKQCSNLSLLRDLQQFYALRIFHLSKY